MKKILPILLFMLLSMQICFAGEETIDDIDSYFQEDSPADSPAETSVKLDGYLQYSEQQQAEESAQEKNAVQLDDSAVSTGINFAKPKKIESKSLISGVRKPNLTPMKDSFEPASKFATQEYNIRPVSSYFVQKIGDFSFGTGYDSYLDSAQVNYSTNVFTRYDWKHFALTGTFAKLTNSNYDTYDNKVYIAPELKLTKRLSLLDVMQSDVEQINKKNELVLRYTPHLKKGADDVQFEVGAGQSYYQDNFVKSSLRFSTRFKL